MLLAGFTFGNASSASEFFALMLNVTSSSIAEEAIIPAPSSPGSTPTVIAIAAALLLAAIVGVTVLERWLKKNPTPSLPNDSRVYPQPI